MAASHKIPRSRTARNPGARQLCLLDQVLTTDSAKLIAELRDPETDPLFRPTCEKFMRLAVLRPRDKRVQAIADKLAVILSTQHTVN